MSGHFTDRDERAWQRRAEQQVAAPLDMGFWIQSLRRVARRRPRAATTTVSAVSAGKAIARPRPCEPA